MLAGLFVTIINEVESAVSKGQLILIDRGLQVQGMVTRDDVFHLSTYSNANYTSLHGCGTLTRRTSERRRGFRGPAGWETKRKCLRSREKNPI